MKVGSGARVRVAAVAVAGLLAGAAVGWILKPPPPVPASPASIGGILEALDDVEKRSAAVVEILNDMVAGRVARDPGALEELRDSMQENVEAIGDIAGQLRLLRRAPP
ncbi:MAG TPA: hypothetical protein VGK88_06200 [bacterium]|jgi:hypothetical protein